MRKILTILLLLITSVTFSQGFLARIDIRQVEDINDSTWRIVGDIVDVTGGYDGLDIDTGFIIFQRGVDTSGITVYDRIRIDSIENATTVQLEALVMAQYTIKNNSLRPMSGSFPIMEKLDTTSLLYKPSWYRYAFEGDYETAVDNENLNTLYDLISNFNDSTAIDLAAIYDSLEVHFDSLAFHRIDLNAIYDSLARHTDTLQSHNTRLIALMDTAYRHTDTLQSHNARINALHSSVDTLTGSVYDSLLDHRNDLTALYDSVARHTDTLQSHNIRINDIVNRVDTVLISKDTLFTDLIQPGWLLRDIIFRNHTAYTGQISAGTRTSTQNLFASEAIAKNKLTTVNIEKTFSESTSIIFSDIGIGDSWNGMIATAYILSEKTIRDVGWILRSGNWDDYGIWKDTESWID